MWKAWIGFNVSHSIALILFGLLYGYLVVCQWEVLRKSYFLVGLGLLVLVAYVVLARVFWFKAPLIGVSAATLLYVAGFVCAFARRWETRRGEAKAAVPKWHRKRPLCTGAKLDPSRENHRRWWSFGKLRMTGCRYSKSRDRRDVFLFAELSREYVARQQSAIS
jgi:hypothetical protein